MDLRYTDEYEAFREEAKRFGFTLEHDVQRYFKRALFDRAFLRTPSVHRERSARLGGW